MSNDDAAYFATLARTERARAKESSSAEVAETHEELARAYEALVEHSSLRPTLRIVVPRRPSAPDPGRRA